MGIDITDVLKKTRETFYFSDTLELCLIPSLVQGRRPWVCENQTY